MLSFRVQPLAGFQWMNLHAVDGVVRWECPLNADVLMSRSTLLTSRETTWIPHGFAPPFCISDA